MPLYMQKHGRCSCLQTELPLSDFTDDLRPTATILFVRPISSSIRDRSAILNLVFSTSSDLESIDISRQPICIGFFFCVSRVQCVTLLHESRNLKMSSHCLAYSV